MSELQPDPLAPASAAYPAAYPQTAVPPGYPPPGYAAQPSIASDEYDNQPPLTQGQRVLDAYLAPSKTFADIRRNRSWWLPFLLIALVSYVFAYSVLHRVGVHQLADNTLHATPAQAQKINDAAPEQRAQIMKFTQISLQVGLYTGPILGLLWYAFLALLVWVGMNFILGGTSTYPGMFAVAVYASLPNILLSLLLTGILWFGDTESFNLTNPAGTNIGYYLGESAPAFLRTLLTSFDVFTLWQIFLLGLGGAIVARIKPARGLTLVFGVWFLIVLIKAGIAAI